MAAKRKPDLQNDLCNIKELKYSEWHHPFGSVDWIFTIIGENVYRKKEILGLRDENNNVLIETDSEPEVILSKKEFSDLLKEAHMEKWKKNYEPINMIIFDGIDWDLDIKFEAGIKSFHCGGSNAYPTNFDLLRKYIV